MMYEKTLYHQKIKVSELVRKIKNAGCLILKLSSLEYNKSLFRDMAEGFKLLTYAMAGNQQESFSLFANWLRLYLRIQKLLPPDKINIKKQFEETVPKSFSYIIASLFYDPDIPFYHQQILQASLELLNVISESTLKKVALLEVKNIFALLDAVHIVSDFYTKFLALQIFLKLLQFINVKDVERHSSDTEDLFLNDILKLTRSAQHNEKNIYQEVRTILNLFYLNFGNSQIYSLWCRSFLLGNKKFLKEANAKKLWIDFHQKTGTITSRGKFGLQSEHNHEVSIKLYIEKLQLNKDNATLIIDFEKPPVFSAKIAKSIENDLRDVRKAIIKLDSYEFSRFEKSNFWLDYLASNGMLVLSDAEGRYGEMTSGAKTNEIDHETYNKTASLALISSENSKSRTRMSSTLQSVQHPAKSSSEITTENINKKTEMPLVSDTTSTTRSHTIERPILSSSPPAKRRFFTKSLKERDEDYTLAPKRKKRQSRGKQPPSKKKINKVKPMIHLAKLDGNPEDAVQEYIENGGYMRITNFVENSENSSAYNEEERRQILENTKNISANIERATKKFFNKTDFDESIYNESNMSLSEVEPGLSYRSEEAQFQISSKTVKTPKNDQKIKSVGKKISQSTKNFKNPSPQIKKSSRKRQPTPLNFNPSTSTRCKISTPKRLKMTKTAIKARNIENPKRKENFGDDESILIDECRHNSLQSIDLSNIFSPINSKKESLDKNIPENARSRPKSVRSEVFSTQMENEDNFEEHLLIDKFFNDRLQYEQESCAPSPLNCFQENDLLHRCRSNSSYFESDIEEADVGMQPCKYDKEESNIVKRVTTVVTSTEISRVFYPNQETQIPLTSQVARKAPILDDTMAITLPRDQQMPEGFPNILTAYQTDLISNLEQITSEINNKLDKDLVEKIKKLAKTCIVTVEREEFETKEIFHKITKMFETIESSFQAYVERTQRFKKLSAEIESQIDEISKNLNVENIQDIYNQAENKLQESSQMYRRTIWKEFAQQKIDYIQRRLTSFLSL